jgi:hypothetical protein
MAITTYAELKTAVNTYGKWSGAYATNIPEWISLAEDWLARNLRVRAMEVHRDIPIRQFITDATVGGTANAITLTNVETTTTYKKGESYTFTASLDNTAATTINVDGKGAKSVYDSDGTTATGTGRIFADGSYSVTYDGTNFRLVPPGAYPLPSGFVGAKRLYIPGSPPWQIGILAPAMFWTKNQGGVAKPKLATVEGDVIVFGPNSPDTFYQVSGLFYKKFDALSADADTNWILTNARGLYLYGALYEGYAYLNDTANMIKYATMRDSLLGDVHSADRDDRYSGDSLVMSSDVLSD